MRSGKPEVVAPGLEPEVVAPGKKPEVVAPGLEVTSSTNYRYKTWYRNLPGMAVGTKWGMTKLQSGPGHRK